ncbi:MAG: SDR family NAD(P)-dependent oxidoreductase [Prolixibacteraceae bacterium]|nr:SDR family NAD(P)-dependent oxidoreductase [Prolixibacteraceae bacterium]
MEQLTIDNLNKKANRVLVTGATGMVGARLVFDLLQNGCTVRALYRNPERIEQFRTNISYYASEADKLTELVEWVQTDILDYPSLFDALQDIDFVYHCAAMVSFKHSEKNAMYETNIQGTANLVNACLESGAKKICHVSSIAALGRIEDGEWITEETAWIPEKKHSGYSISKFHSEMEIWRGINEGLEAVIVNPSVILGPGDWDNGSPVFFKQIYKGMLFYTRGGTGFVDVRDVTSAMLLLTDEKNWENAKNNRFLINSSNHSYQHLFTSIAKTLNVKPPFIRVTKPMMEIAWRLALLAGFFSGRDPLVTRDSVQGACKRTYFDGAKISRLFKFDYRPFDESIAYIGNIFLNTIH